MPQTTLGVIVGNRDFFPDPLVVEARRDIERLFEELGIEAVMLDESQSKLGSVETWAHAQRCAELFRANRDRIDGVLVSLPNFGDEKGVADTLKLAELNVPVLVQGYPDDLDQFGVDRRRDAFCGKISVCNNLRQYGIPFTLTELHTVPIPSEEFRRRPARFPVGLPRGAGPAPRPHRRCRRPAQRVQHDALQRETAPGGRHQRHHHRPLGRVRPRAQTRRRRRARRAQAWPISAATPMPPACRRSLVAADGQARRRA